MKKIKPITQEEIDAMSDVQKRRLLVRDILWQIDNGQLDSEETGYVTLKEEKCSVCAVGAAYVTAQKIRGSKYEWLSNSEGYFDAAEGFGFTDSELKYIERVFESDAYGTIFAPLEYVINKLYPAITDEEDENAFDRTKRLRALYQYIWDNEDCKMVPLKGNE